MKKFSLLFLCVALTMIQFSCKKEKEKPIDDMQIVGLAWSNRFDGVLDNHVYSPGDVENLPTEITVPRGSEVNFYFNLDFSDTKYDDQHITSLYMTVTPQGGVSKTVQVENSEVNDMTYHISYPAEKTIEAKFTLGFADGSTIERGPLKVNVVSGNKTNISILNDNDGANGEIIVNSNGNSSIKFYAPYSNAPVYGTSTDPYANVTIGFPGFYEDWYSCVPIFGASDELGGNKLFSIDDYKSKGLNASIFSQFPALGVFQGAKMEIMNLSQIQPNAGYSDILGNNFKAALTANNLMSYSDLEALTFSNASSFVDLPTNENDAVWIKYETIYGVKGVMYIFGYKSSDKSYKMFTNYQR